MASVANKSAASDNEPSEVQAPARDDGNASPAPVRPGPDVSPVGKGRNGARDYSSSNSLVPPNPQQPPISGMSYQTKQGPAGRSAPVSSVNSVTSSRETSPIRPPLRSINSASASRSGSRSRKNSHELSPTRGPSGLGANYPSPSAALLQRTLMNANKPQLPPPSVDIPSDLGRPSKSNMPPRSGDSSLHWPISPRLKSPPPSTSSRNNLPPTSAPRRPEQDVAVANMSSKRHHSGPTTDAGHPDEEFEDNQTRLTSWATSRGASGAGSTLETVQEATPPRPSAIQEPRLEEEEPAPAKPAKSTAESGSDSGGNWSAGPKGEDRRRITTASARPGDIMPKRSLSSLSVSRGKLGDASARNMIVETETVRSVPQVSLGGGTVDRGVSGRSEAGGTIRLKPSDETIRPKKEKKKPSRKLTALPAGTVSSKADIFEARVASAVDEADSSDSEETFVYESNPPDTLPTRQQRYHHSRTPSATSTASQVDQFGARSRQGLRDGAQSVTGKKSMKFINNTYNGNLDGEVGDQSNGRGSSRTNGHLQTSRHHHVGRHPRNTNHPPLFSETSLPSPPGGKSNRHFIGNGNGQPRSGSPRASQGHRASGATKKNGDTYGYDLDGEGADDECTPLIGSARLGRTRHSRRPNSGSLRQLEYLEQRQRGCLARYGICVIIMLLLFIVVGGATTFIIALTEPLTDVHVKKIHNVLASEQEIMLDLDVRAINPNLFALTVSDMDVNIFARSRFVGIDSFERDRDRHLDALPRSGDSRMRAIRSQIVSYGRTGQFLGDSSSPSASQIHPHITDGIDEGTDPIGDPVGDSQTMLLGRIYQFDSPLTFEPSPWKRIPSGSVGELRLAKPGNKTEEGGTERWERVLQHPFELIVRGVLKYQLPLSSRIRSESISSKVEVIPDQDSDGDDDGDDDGNGDKNGDKKNPHIPDDAAPSSVDLP